MNRRIFLGRSASAVMAGWLLPAFALPVEGRNYAALSPAQAPETGDKVEVLEAFSYACPHCYHFEPILNNWAKTAPADVELRKMPVSFNREPWANLARLYYALEAIGEIKKLHGKVFDAIHAENVDLANPQVANDWVAKQGVDGKKFADAYKSFSVQSKVARLPDLTRNYGVTSVPTVIVDGKYKVIGATSHEDVLRTTGELIQLARSQRTAKAASGK